MTVGELVALLQEQPDHWPVAVQVTSCERSELTGEDWYRHHRSEVLSVEVLADGVPPGFMTPTVVLS